MALEEWGVRLLAMTRPSTVPAFANKWRWGSKSLGLPQSVWDWPPEWKELYEERAALMEFLAGLPREEAEVKAQMEIREEFARRKNRTFI